MFDSLSGTLVETFSAHPYLGVAVVFLFCGAGLPLPEEIVLVVAGYACFKFPERAQALPMMAACAFGILLGDTVPYLLGRVLGTRVLRLRYLRIWVTRRRLISFDRWFRKHGDLVIFIGRFLTGIRLVAFFTAGTLKMPWPRFLLLDGLGIAVLVPPLVLLGYSGGEYIDRAILLAQGIERGILIGCGLLLIGAVLWYWLRRRARPGLAPGEMAESFVEPTVEPAEALDDDAPESPTSDVEGA